MANWCWVKYHVTADDPEKLKPLAKCLNELNSKKLPYGLSLSTLILYLGGNPDDFYCRGSIDDIEISEDYIGIWGEHAWGEMSQVRHFIEDTLDVSISYYAEEPGMEIYETNDFNIFPYEYIIDSEESGMEYYENEEETINDIKSFTEEVPFTKDIETIHDACEYCEYYTDKTGRYLAIHNIVYNDD